MAKYGKFDPRNKKKSRDKNNSFDSRGNKKNNLQANHDLGKVLDQELKKKYR